MVRERKKAFKILRSNPTQDNSIYFKLCRAKARKTVKEAKRKCWRDFCGTLGSDTPVRQVWSRIHKMSGKMVKSLMPALSDGCSDVVNNVEQMYVLKYFKRCIILSL